MCGLAGFIGNFDKETRQCLVIGLGSGIMQRGKDASGYVTVNNKDVHMNKSIGPWLSMSNRFIGRAAINDICMMHSRMATCRNGEVYKAAHPFCIKRDKTTILWGMHNGIIYNAFDHAQARGRKILVDSQEILELVADNNLAEIKELRGYGVLTWIDANDREGIHFTKLSDSGDLVIAVVEGGLIYASTLSILNNALKFAQLRISGIYDKQLDKSIVYVMRRDGLYKTTREPIVLGTWETTYDNTWWQKESSKYSKFQKTTAITDSKPSINDNAIWNQAYPDEDSKEWWDMMSGQPWRA